MKYDFLIVGAGMFGSTFARLATDAGYSCIIIDKRTHIAGNCYSENKDGIDIHKYGPHIFHTNNKEVWDFINRFGDFNNYQHKVKVNYENKIYSFPINLFTLNQIFGIQNPTQASVYLKSVRVKNDNPKNLEEWVLDKVGWEIYEAFVRGYTTKQWNKHPKELPASIIKRIPIRLNFNDNYFNDTYQGVPISGYTNLFNNMLDGIPVELGIDYLTQTDRYDSVARAVVYTGPIDEFFDYEFGELEWRSLRFEELYMKNKDFQGTSIINYTSENVPQTRIVEYKHFSNPNIENTVIVKEYPQDHMVGLEKFYPISTDRNKDILAKYKRLINTDKYIFGGRLAEYQYYDMHQVIASAMQRYRTCVNF